MVYNQTSKKRYYIACTDILEVEFKQLLKFKSFKTVQRPITNTPNTT